MNTQKTQEAQEAQETQEAQIPFDPMGFSPELVYLVHDDMNIHLLFPDSPNIAKYNKAVCSNDYGFAFSYYQGTLRSLNSIKKHNVSLQETINKNEKSMRDHINNIMNMRTLYA